MYETNIKIAELIEAAKTESLSSGGKKAKVVLIVGDPNTGKSVSGCTFPKDMFVFDFDGDGIESARNAKDKSGNLIVSDYNRIQSISFIKSKTYKLDFRTSFKGKMAPAHTQEAGILINKFNDVLESIQPNQFRTIMIDSLTSMFRLWKEAILFMNQQPHLQIQDYITLENVLYSQFIPSLKALPVDYVLLIDHTNIDKDEISGKVSEFPVGPSVAMGRIMPQVFSEVWRQDVIGGNFVWRTRDNGLFVGAGSRSHFPEIIDPATYQQLKKLNPNIP